MYLSLGTCGVWCVEGNYSAWDLISSVSIISNLGDVLVLGCYNPSDAAFDWLATNQMRTVESPKPYDHSFELNRREYPRGQAFELALSDDIIAGLKTLCKLERGSLDKALFFDHLVMYRCGLPLLPLVNYHDAFSGGRLYCSGLYKEHEMRGFSNALGARVRFDENPEL